MPDYQQRLQKAQQLMQQHGLDALCVSAPSDLLYLIGYHFHPSERLTLLTLSRDGSASIIMPQFETPRLGETRNWLEVVSWTETDNPMQLVAQVLSKEATGTLAVSEQMWAGFLVGMLAELPKARFMNANQIITTMRMLKDADEIAALEQAQHSADTAFEEICKRPFAGRTELDIQQALTAIRQELGLSNCYGGIVGSGPQHSASPHHLTSDRVIQKGDAIVMDYGGTYHGYHADITRTVHVGPPSQKFREAYEIVDEANRAAFTALRPGVTCESIDKAARDVIEKAGYGQYFTHRVGHGIGLDGHEPPYLVGGNMQLLQAGMTFSDEPGIYIPGEFGIRIEDMVAVTETGGRNLNRSTHKLMIVD
jgi:Xaa-Pro aminopeptidase